MQRPPVFASGSPGEKDLLHVALVGLDHFLDHLAADGAGFAGGQVAVVAVLQVDADLPWCSFSSYFLPGSGLGGSGKLRTGAVASSPTKR